MAISFIDFAVRLMEYLTEFVTNCVSVPTSLLATSLSEQLYEDLVCCESGYLIGWRPAGCLTLSLTVCRALFTAS